MNTKAMMEGQLSRWIAEIELMLRNPAMSAEQRDHLTKERAATLRKLARVAHQR